MKILSSEQVRQWDEYTILNEPVSSLDLMERAAAQCSQWLLKKMSGRKFSIFCGKGNNGGDGLAIARQLTENAQAVVVYILESGTPGTDDFETNLSRLRSCPVGIHFIQHTDSFPSINPEYIVIDALFGSGLSRPLEGLPAQLVEHINTANAQVIAVDLPSGMFADKPVPGVKIVKANHTLTFQQLRFCFLFPENQEFFGKVEVLQIGLHPGYPPNVASLYELSDLEMIRQIYKPRTPFSHKGTYGHALIIAGEKGKMGAAILSVKGCLRAGAGLVTAMVPEHQFDIIQVAVPEAMATAQELTEAIDWSRYAVVGIGPGIGTRVDGAGLVQDVLTHFNKPMVVDADGLNVLSNNQELLLELPPGSILTPHPKEFERLFGKSGNHLERIQLARTHAQKLFVYIIVKGHYSFVACPDGLVYFNSTGNAGMATGGSGDVLTGILAGLLAQGYSSKEACLLGMFLHGLSADIAITSISQEALIAGDIAGFLGKAFLSLQR